MPFVLALLGVLSSNAQARLTVIALTGDTPPRGTGVFAEGLAAPALNDNGVVAFVSNLRQNGAASGSGIFRGDGTPGSLTVILLEGDPAPGNGNIGVAGVNATRQLNLNNSDEVAVLMELTNTLGGPSDNRAIYRGDGGVLTEIARTNDQVPGGDGRILSLAGQPLALNDDGQVAFETSLLDTLGPDDAAHYRGDGGDLTEIVRKHRQGPGSELTFSLLDGQRVAMNATGQVLFTGTASDAGAPQASGIYRGDGATTVAIVSVSDPAPGGNGTFSSVILELVAFNDAGQAAFVGQLANTAQGTADNLGVFRGDGENLVTIARKGAQLPDENGFFLAFPESPVLNDQGHVLFLATVDAASNGSNGGLFVGDGTTTEVVARINDPAPGGGRFSDFDAFAFNDAKQTVFYAKIDLENGGATNDSFGLFFHDPTEGLQTVARRGDQLPGVGAIGPITFTGGPRALSEERDGFNEHGQVAFQCTVGLGFAVVVWDASASTTTTTIPSTTTTLAAAENCSAPVTNGSSPTASDCLFILRAAVGSNTCSPACVCSPNGDANITASDALVCLKKAVGQSVVLDCPCTE